MTFASFDMLVRVKSTDPSGFLDGFHALGSDDRRTRLGIPDDPFAFSFSQGREQAKPGALEAQAREMIKDGLPRREIGWQVAPGTACVQDVKDRIEDGAQRVSGWPAASGQGREMLLQTPPLRIRKIAGITGTHPFSVSREPLPFPKHALSSSPISCRSMISSNSG